MKAICIKNGFMEGSSRQFAKKEKEYEYEMDSSPETAFPYMVDTNGSGNNHSMSIDFFQEYFMEMNFNKLPDDMFEVK